ncbi:MAG TPA: NAD-dependent epimerase/dehydratase family protein [Acidimicrobiales bacterium]|nr:NAD-dependent epimerase/dehydratase family protein [Acidimicrobiales bacterium]
MTTSPRPVVAITGASGYLGSALVSAFESAGHRVRRLVRSPAPGTDDVFFDLASADQTEALKGVDLLVHCAYDLALTKRSDIWRSNVFSTIALFDRALSEGVDRTITLSSMSAYPGTRQHYGRAKLAIEGAARARGMCIVRPGLVYGPAWRGMAGTLRRLAALPVLPDFGPEARQFTVAEQDFAAAIVALAGATHVPSVPVGIAHPDAVPFRRLLTSFAATIGKGRPHFIPTPPRLAYGALRAAEVLPLPLPVRADSLLGLVRPAPNVPHLEVLDQLGVVLQPFALPDAVPS